MTDADRRYGGSGSGEDESLTKPPNFNTINESRFNTNRAAGFRGGTTVSGGNVSFEGGDALRGIRAQRRTDDATAEARANYDALVSADAAERKRQAEEDLIPNKTEEVIGEIGTAGENLGKMVKDGFSYAGKEFSNFDKNVIQPIADPIKGAGRAIDDNFTQPIGDAGRNLESGVRNVGRSIDSGVRNVGRTIAEPVGTVICTQLMTQGLLSNKLWRNSALHAENLPRCVMRGYRLWSIPYVFLMRNSIFATYLVKDLVRWRAEEVAYQIGKRDRGNFKGKIVRLLFEPVCAVIGLFCPEQNFMKLYNTKEG